MARSLLAQQTLGVLPAEMEYAQWYACPEAVILGVIMPSAGDSTWRFVVLSRNREGHYVCVATGRGCLSKADCRTALFAACAELPRNTDERSELGVRSPSDICR
jgi:hypothetical protein